MFLWSTSKIDPVSIFDVIFGVRVVVPTTLTLIGKGLGPFFRVLGHKIRCQKLCFGKSAEQTPCIILEKSGFLSFLLKMAKTRGSRHLGFNQLVLGNTLEGSRQVLGHF